MVNESRKNPQQVPTEQNEDQTKRIIQQQNETAGEHRSENVKDFPKTAAVAKLLEGLNFPADKQRIVDFAKSHSSSGSNISENSDDAISALQKIQDRSYNNVYEVTEAADLV
jgi:hypothetical protein